MATERTGQTPASSREPVEEFSLPAEAVIEGYYINRGGDRLRYPYGRSAEGFWAADEFGWAAWHTAADMTRAIECRRAAPQAQPSETPACVLGLIELASAAWGGDKDAAQQLRVAGELLDLAGGAAALTKVQGMAHDHLLVHGGGRGRDLAGHLGDYWEHIPSWSAL